MTIIETIKNLLTEINNISIGYSEINFLTPDTLDDGQVGYSIDSKGNSLLTGEFGDWQDGWIIVGSDNLGDPIFIDCADKNLPVLCAQHGEGEWEASVIANSIEKFKEIVSDLIKLSVDRQSPVKIEENPFTKTEIKNFLSKVKKNNKNVEIWWWEQFLDHEDE